MSSWFSSEDTHELGGDVGDAVADRVGESSLRSALGGDRFSFKSSFGPLSFLRLMAVLCFFKVGGGSVFGREVRKNGTSKVLVIFVVARIGEGSGPFYIRKTKGVI